VAGRKKLEGVCTSVGDFLARARLPPLLYTAGVVRLSNGVRMRRTLRQFSLTMTQVVKRSDAETESSLGAYERERLARMERNRMLMEKLGVTSLSNRLETITTVREQALKPIGYSKRTPKAEKRARNSENEVDRGELEPRRRSLRVRGIAPAGAGTSAEEPKNSQLQLKEEETSRGPFLEDQTFAEVALENYGASSESSMVNDDCDRSDVDDVDGSKDGGDQKSLCTRRARLFQRAWCSAMACTSLSTSEHLAKDPSRFHRWVLDEASGFFKLVPARIYSATMHPRLDAWTMMVGDKAGHVGLAVVPRERVAEHAVQVLCMRVHRDTTAGMAPRAGSANSQQLLTVSYDGSARLLDIEKQTIQTVLVDERERIFKSIALSTENDNVFWTTASHRSLGGFLVRHDLRQSQKSFDAFGISDSRVYSVSLQHQGAAGAVPGHDGLLAVTTARDGVLIFDQRRIETGATRRSTSKPLFALPHERATTAATWSPSATRLLTTCYDDLLRIWHYDGSECSLEHRFVHNNHTGRWVTPFEACWDPATDHKIFACGSMNHNPVHGVDLFHVELNKRSVWNRLTGEPMTAIAAVLAWHPAGHALIGGTASGRVYLWGEAHGSEGVLAA